MFENCGEKLKGCAVFFFALECIGSIISGLAMMLSSMFWGGLGVIVGGIAVAYLTALVVAAFGDLVTAAEETAHYTRDLCLQKENSDKEPFYNKPKDKPSVGVASSAVGQPSGYVPAWTRVQQDSEN